MAVYTRTGDSGETGLPGGSRVRKCDRRVCACGEVDELNAVLGWCAAAAPANLQEPLRREMERLFALGAHLAAPPDAPQPACVPLPAWDGGAAAVLEREMDDLDADLPPLRQFILPGGTELAARLHVARAVCRRAERALVALAAEEPVDPAFLAYLNRLSDWLFVLARGANRAGGGAEIPWVPTPPSGGPGDAPPPARPAPRGRRARPRR